MNDWIDSPPDRFVDRHGVELCGEDEHGMWQGTDAWPWPLVSAGEYYRDDSSDDSDRLVLVKRRRRVSLTATWPDGRRWDAVVLAPSKAYARQYFANWGFLRDLTVL